MVSLMSSSPQTSELQKLMAGYMPEEELLQALEIAIRSRDAHAILQVLDTIKNHHSGMTSDLNASDLIHLFEARLN
jgi:hypothetical protein